MRSSFAKLWSRPRASIAIMSLLPKEFPAVKEAVVELLPVTKRPRDLRLYAKKDARAEDIQLSSFKD